MEEGAESVLLPFKTVGDLPEDTKVEWNRLMTNTKMKVHVYPNSSDRPEEQDESYRNRTEMKDDLLRTGDLSLILKSPKDTDTGEYWCSVSNRERNIWRGKKIQLKVKGQFEDTGLCVCL